MATPGRRSMRHSPRTSSPATRRSTRASPVVKVMEDEDDSDTIVIYAEGYPHKNAATTNLSDHKNGSNKPPETPSTPSGQTTQGKDRLRGKSLLTASSVTGPAPSRSSSRQRKPARIAEMIKDEAQSEARKNSVKDEQKIAVESVDQVEVIRDDDYTPSEKPTRNSKAKKSKESKHEETPSRHTIPDSKQLQTIFEAVVHRSMEVPDEVLAVALRRVHHRTFTDEDLTNLLYDIMEDDPPAEVMNSFRRIIKDERKQAKIELSGRVLGSERTSASDAVSRPKSSRTSESKSASPSKTTSPRKSTASLATPSHKRISGSKLADSAAFLSSRLPATPSSPSVNMTVMTRRGSRRQQAATPTPPSPKKVGNPSIDIAAPTPGISTRNSKKRPSATPEPSAKQNGTSISRTGDQEPPRKKTKLSRETKSSSSSALSDLSASSRESSTEAASAPAAGLSLNASFSSTITMGPKVGGNLKRKPEPAQKARLLAGAKFGLGLPDEEMLVKKDEMRRMEFQGYRVKDSDMRNPVKPSRRRSVPPPVDVLGVYTPAMRDQLEHSNMVSPASSSVQGDYLVPPPPGRAKPSRSATPALTGKKTARVKVSPMKKKNTIVAALGARTSGGRESPVGFKAEGDEVSEPGDGYMADSDDQSDNVDYCVTCNESGELLCCDGCPRSFHFLCCDPPLEEEPSPERDWFCHVCENKRNPIPKPPRGLFSLLMHDVNRQNASIYRLPKSIRTHFEGVTESEDGAYLYEDAMLAKHRTRATGPSAEIEADNFKIKDSKGSFVLCASCGKTSNGKREMVKCDHCTQYWHLDCLDPPPANPPFRPFDGRPRALWKCPAHAEVDPTQSGVHKLRRPKNYKIVDTMLNRGHKNSGDIEIELESSEDESEPEVNDDGTVYRLTERSIKLDFITRVKEKNEEEERKRLFEEEMRQASLNAERQILERFYNRDATEQNAVDALLGLRSDIAAARPNVTRDPPSLLPNGQRSSLATASNTNTKQRLQSLVSSLMDDAPHGFDDPESSEGTREDLTNGNSTKIGTPNSSPALRSEFSGVAKRSRSVGPRLAAKDKQALRMLKELISKRLDDDSDEEFTDGGNPEDVLQMNGTD